MAQTMIAVVDDEVLVCSAVASLLRSLGYQTTTFHSPAEFLACSDVNFACLVSDVQMPAMSGPDLHRQLRAQGNSVPMILMTAYPTPTISSFAAETDIVALIEKPIASGELSAAIEQALR